MEKISKQWQPHTMAETFERIIHQEDVWNAIGDFLDDWRYCSTGERQALVLDPIGSATTPEQHKWATFCAAIVEYLCKQDNIAFPTWTGKPEYHMEHPWFLYKNWRLRAWQLTTTPIPFRSRNIFGGDRILERA